ncbi:ABC-ATPase domain-containing protein [Lachnospiraceae bacterium OttesenSCG-928-D06]|nr:ABC-ATPase domain-containing protein [Lachnospiraceae bacterium OttesenSCG-928-D06]
MKTSSQLRTLLTSIDRKSYGAYKEVQGIYQFQNYLLAIDHVQGDPFASPSKLHLEIKGNTAGFPSHLYNTVKKRIALQDYLTRQFGKQLYMLERKSSSGSGKSGLIRISSCGQEILERSCFQINPDNGSLFVRIEVGFPAFGRSINANSLIKILFDQLPLCITKGLLYQSLKHQELLDVEALCEDQDYIRKELKKRNLSAFIINGAILPRASGVSEKPLHTAIPFCSPASLEVTLNLPHKGEVKGMGIPQGIMLIVGGGFHGKSTLLRALEMGVYDHIALDGREYVITDDSALKLRSEDSRYISKTDISLFINHLPGKEDTQKFSTLNASGSTSQAANVVEGMESASQLFLIDEDTSATNFMIRDELMQSVVSDEEEPITPFIGRVCDLYKKAGISSIIVAGSSGSYFHVADYIIQMKDYVPFDITAKAKEKAAAYPPFSASSTAFTMPSYERYPKATALLSGDRTKCKVFSMDSIQINKDEINLRYLEQLVDTEQLWALTYLLTYAAKHYINGKRTLREIIDLLEQQIDTHGLASLSESRYLSANLSRPRRQEIFACFNRCHNLSF